MKNVPPNSSFNQPAPLLVSVAAIVERSLSIACNAVYIASMLPSVFPCVTLVGFISAVSFCFSEKRYVNACLKTGELRGGGGGAGGSPKKTSRHTNMGKLVRFFQNVCEKRRNKSKDLEPLIR